jgi:hypothetical protein
MIGEFASQGNDVDHVLLVNLSLERTGVVQLKDAAKSGTFELYSPEDAHLANCGPEFLLPAGQGALLKLKQ